MPLFGKKQLPGPDAPLADHLAAIGIETGWGEVRDGHTWTCWRDTLHPHLTDLLRRVSS